MAVTPKRGWRVPGLGDPENVPFFISQLAQDIENDPLVVLPDTGWVECTGDRNPNITGPVAKVRRIGVQVYGRLQLSFTGGWPNTQVTAFTLPSLDFAPPATTPPEAVITHRMSMGAAAQGPAGELILRVDGGTTAVFAGANGASNNSGLYWNGPLWVVI